MLDLPIQVIERIVQLYKELYKKAPSIKEIREIYRIWKDNK